MSFSSLPAALDPLKLRARLAAALAGGGWDAPSSRAAAIAHLKLALQDGRAHAATRLKDAGGGLEAVRICAASMNAVLQAVFDAAADDESARSVAMVAQGGFGVGELAPKSDVDLLFLKSASAGPEADALIERILYILWDIGVDIGGGAARTIDETLAMAREDLSERTALLSLRHVAGSETLTARLARRFEDEICAGGQAKFVEAKLLERDQRLEKAGRSRYTVEPNIKNGKGGLRDLQLMRWMAQFLYGEDAFERWVTEGLLTVDDVEKYLDASDFLWTVRFHLHEITNHKEDRLSFDVQPELASRMGFTDGDNVSGVETFMRRYFRTAMDVGALTRLICAKLEADRYKPRPTGLARFLPGASSSDKLESRDFEIRDGRIAFIDPGRISHDPVLLMRLFQMAAAHRLDLHPEAVAAVGRSLRHVDDDFRNDPRAARAFFSILLDAEAPHAIMRLMTEAGLLGRFIPEFGDIVARTQFNMYHRYTVDEHTLNALGLLREIENGDHPLDHPLATKITHLIAHRRALHLAVLLHDTGKGAGDQCVEGAARALTACERLGVDGGEAELVSWLIANHLLMSDTAQRRDLGDPRTVADFASAVGSLERLRLLTILTVVDIRAVGPGVWNAWKGQLLRDLYAATAAVLEEGGESSVKETGEALHDRADLARQSLINKVARVDKKAALAWADLLDDAYWLAFGEADRLRHAAFARTLLSRGEEVAAAARVDKRRAATEVMIFAPDRERLFADIAAALAGIGADIVGAHIATTRAGDAFDIFYVQDASGLPYGAQDPARRDELIQAVRRAAAAEPVDFPSPVTPPNRRAAVFQVTPDVRISNDAADSATLVEASGRDRPGLLSELANVIADHELALTSAQIDGYGERAVDVFYVTMNGEKLRDEAVIASLRDAMFAVLSAEEAAHAKRAAERGLARAPASALR